MVEVKMINNQVSILNECSNYSTIQCINDIDHSLSIEATKGSDS